MAEIKIRSETPNQRCEICHQTDCFNPINNFCTRCNNLYNFFKIRQIYFNEKRQAWINFRRRVLDSIILNNRSKGWLLSSSSLAISIVNQLLFANSVRFSSAIFKLASSLVVLLNIYIAIFVLRKNRLPLSQRMIMFVISWFTLFGAFSVIYQDVIEESIGNYQGLLFASLTWIAVWTCLTLIYGNEKS